MNIQPIAQSDFYKVGHKPMYPQNMTKLYSNFTPRKSRINGINEVVVFGIQYFVKEYLIKQWNENFFGYPQRDVATKKRVLDRYTRLINNTLGTAVELSHIEELWDLGYLPIEIKALPEGRMCPIGVPMFTITNTHPNFGWLVNFLETIISCTIWQSSTSATIAHQYRKLLNKYALETTGSTEGVQWQGHDFSMRGMSSLETACMSGAGHLLSFTGTDTIPAIEWLEKYYNADVEKELVGASIPATEHSVMCVGTKDNEIGTFKSLLDKFPTGILSVVSDTWDLWVVCTKYLPELKEQILARDGKLVIRPDSGDPVDIICGIGDKYKNLSKWYKYQDSPVNHPEFFEDILMDEVNEDTPHGEQGPEEWENIYQINGKYYKAKIHNVQWNRYDKQYYFIDMYEKAKITVEEVESLSKQKGVIELLWDVFGGTINDKGYKVLNSHIGAIYGDSITLDRGEQICERLKAKGFASTNIVLGIGSYTYQYNTRDTFSFAVKATYCELSIEETIASGSGFRETFDGIECREIFKDPVTDDGTKKSARGLLAVFQNDNDKYELFQQVDWNTEKRGSLKTIFKDGELAKDFSLAEVRKNLLQYG